MEKDYEWVLDFKNESYDRSPLQEVLPPGIYLMQIEDVDLKTSSTKNKYFEWLLKVCEGNYTGKTLKVITTIIKGKRWLCKQILEATVGNWENSIVALNKRDVLGKKVYAKVIIRANMYKGVTRDINGVQEFWKEIPYTKLNDWCNEETGLMPTEELLPSDKLEEEE